MNLETAITDRGRFAPGKQVHYRMSPANLRCLIAGRPDVCILANNHVLDFGEVGLADTLEALSGARLRTAGAGLSAAEAQRVTAVPVQSGGRVLVVAFGTASSGIPGDWAAAGRRPGVAFLPSLSSAVAGDITELADQVREPGDLVVVSLHWGSNWGYDVPEEQVLQARRMRLQHASAEDADWLRAVLERASRRFGISFDLPPCGVLVPRGVSSG